MKNSSRPNAADSKYHGQCCTDTDPFAFFLPDLKVWTLCLSQFGLLWQKQQNFISQFWRLNNQDQDSVSGESPPPGLQMAIFLLSPHTAGRVRELSRASFIRALTLFLKAPCTWLNDLPKAPPPNTHWGLGFNIWILLGHKPPVHSNVGCFSVCSSGRLFLPTELSRVWNAWRMPSSPQW